MAQQNDQPQNATERQMIVMDWNQSLSCPPKLSQKEKVKVEDLETSVFGPKIRPKRMLAAEAEQQAKILIGDTPKLNPLSARGTPNTRATRQAVPTRPTLSSFLSFGDVGGRKRFPANRHKNK